MIHKKENTKKHKRLINTYGEHGIVVKTDKKSRLKKKIQIRWSRILDKTIKSVKARK